MSFTTKRGDQGQTDIAKRRVSKTDSRIELLGQFDELSAQFILVSCLGLPWDEKLRKLVMTLATISSIISGYASDDQFSSDYQVEIEQWISELGSMQQPFQFQYPFNNKVGAQCNLLRTKVRQVERTCWQVNSLYPLPTEILSYMNRLSDLAFAMQLSATQQ